MAYIITRLCRDCVDTGCVAVCPVDCIYEYTGADKRVAEPALHPSRRVHRLRRVRARVPVAGDLRGGRRPRRVQGRHAAQLQIMENMGDFKVAQQKKVEHPTADQVAANKQKWGWTLT